MASIDNVLINSIEKELKKYAEVIEERGERSETSVVKVWRAFDDLLLDTESDSVLKRRIMSSQQTRRFDQCVLDIKTALGEQGDRYRAFIINIVCPKYEANKDIVELILNTAILSEYDTDEGGSVDERISDITERYHQARRNVVDDIDVTDFYNKNAAAPDMGAVISERANRSFFGEPSYNPRDPRNLLYSNVQYWASNPLPPGTSNTGNLAPNHTPNESPRYIQRSLELGIDPLSEEPPHHAFSTPLPKPEYGQEPESISAYRDKSRYNLSYRKKGNADWVARSVDEIESRRSENPFIKLYPGLMPTERSDFFLRFNLDDPESIVWVHKNQEDISIENKSIYEVESSALRNIRNMIDHGLRKKTPEFKKKWNLYTRLLAAVQGTPQISLFHEGGFDDATDPDTGDIVSYGQPRRGTVYTGDDYEEQEPVNESEVNAIIDDFMQSIVDGSSFIKPELKSDSSTNQESIQDNVTAVEDKNIENMSEQEIDQLETQRWQAILSEINDRVDYDISSPERIPRNYSNEAEKQKARDSETVKVLAEKFEQFMDENNDKQISKKKIAKFMSKKGRGMTSFAANYPGYVLNYLKYSQQTAPVNASASNKDVLKTAKIHGNITNYELRQHVKERLKGIYQGNIENVPGTLFEHMNKSIRQSFPGGKVSEQAVKSSVMEYLIQSFIVYMNNMISSDGDVVKKSEVDEKRSFSSDNEIMARIAVAPKIVPFSKGIQKNFGIPVEDPVAASAYFSENFREGTSAYIVGDDSSDRLILHSAIVCDSMGREAPYSINGPFLKLEFNVSNLVEHSYSKGSYKIYFSSSSQSSSGPLSGLKSKIYEEIYGKAGKRVMRLHEENNVEINTSIYPWWAPSAFDYRERVEEEGGVGEVTLGHPNNAYNIKIQLDKAIKARSYLESRASLDKKNSDYYRKSIAILNKAIEEMRVLLFHWHHGQDENGIVVDEEKKPRRDNSGSMLRDISSSYKTEEWEETVRLCQKSGLNIGFMDQYFNWQTVPQFFSKEDKELFLKIRKSVEEKYKSRRNLFVLRSADALLSSSVKSNGFFTLEERPSGSGISAESLGEEVSTGEREIRWGTEFSSAIAQLYKKSIIKQYDGSGSKNRANAHVILISSEPLPPIPELGEGSMAHVVIPADTIGNEEIKEMIDYYSDVIKKEHKKSDGLTPEMIKRIDSFIIPTSFIRQLQSNLSNLSFDVVRAYIETKIKDFFSIYLPGGVSVVQIVDGQMMTIKHECDGMRTDDTVLRSLNVRTSLPRFTIDEYVTNRGGEWSAHISDQLKTRVENIQRMRRIIDLFQRGVDESIGFGSYMVADGKVKFSASVSSHASGLVWFPLDGAGKVHRVDFNASSSIISDLAVLAEFSISETIHEALAREGYENIEYDTGNLSACKASMQQRTSHLESEISNEKKSYPVLSILEGSPGTGKSIFAEVLASSLDCRYCSTTLNQIVNSGTPELRGGAEKNMIRFLEKCRNMEDTVILIDEIDRFLINSGMSGASDDVQRVLEMLQSRWDQSGDFPLYRAHNLHIVTTTNNIDLLLQHTGALVTRMRRHTVELPSDEQTLRELFLGKAARNNLMNLLCGDDIALAQMAKELLDLYSEENPDSRKISYRNSLERRILHVNPNFFTDAALIQPRKAHKEWLSAMGLSLSANAVPLYMAGSSSITTEEGTKAKFDQIFRETVGQLCKKFKLNVNTENISEIIITPSSGQDKNEFSNGVSMLNKYLLDLGFSLKGEPVESGNSFKIRVDVGNMAFEEDVNTIQDFVNGWNLVMEEFQQTNLNVSATSNNQPVEFNPLSIACKRLSEIMTIKGPVTGKKYAATSLRELMETVRDIFQSHQKFLSGDKKSLPFNWKVLLATVMATGYRANVDESNVDPADWRSPQFQEDLASKVAQDGFEQLKKFSGITNPYKGAPPLAAFCTRNQFEQAEKRKDSAVMSMVDDERKGLDTLVKQVKERLYIGDSRFEDEFSALVKKITEDASIKNPEALKAQSILSYYIEVRNEIKSILSSISSSTTYDKNLHDELMAHILALMTYYSANAWIVKIIYTAYFVQPKMAKFENVFKKMENGIKGVKSAYLVADSILTSENLEKSLDSRWKQIYTEAEKSLSLDTNRAVKSYFSVVHDSIPSSVVTEYVDKDKDDGITSFTMEEIRKQMNRDRGKIDIEDGDEIPQDETPEEELSDSDEDETFDLDSPSTPPSSNTGIVPPDPNEDSSLFGDINLQSLSNDEIKTSSDYFYNFLVNDFKKKQIKKSQSQTMAVPIPAAVEDSKDYVKNNSFAVQETTKTPPVNRIITEDPTDSFVLDPRFSEKMREFSSTMSLWYKESKQKESEGYDNGGFVQLFRK